MDTVETLKSKFRIGDCIDMYAANAAIALAISEELKPLSESSVNAIWQSVLVPEDFQYVVDQGGKTIFGVSIIFHRFAEFADALAEDLGLDHGEDSIVGEWISDSMPKTRAIFSALLDVTMEYLSEMSAMFKKEGGTSPGEVLIQSLVAGESYEQTATRVHNQAHGLREVKPKD
ncbi:hypothetical protein V0M98_33425 (plasmid) [Pseudomonas silesiensis]|uniref:hypothetical protein n=1 Tax=Pseudomonas silesiensis TaxID=1853130 RepID=UPI0030D1F554